MIQCIELGGDTPNTMHPDEQHTFKLTKRNYTTSLGLGYHEMSEVDGLAMELTWDQQRDAG